MLRSGPRRPLDGLCSSPPAHLDALQVPPAEDEAQRTAQALGLALALARGLGRGLTILQRGAPGRSGRSGVAGIMVPLGILTNTSQPIYTWATLRHTSNSAVPPGSRLSA